MNKPVAFQIAPIGNVVLYRPMDQKEYDACLNGEPVDENTPFTKFEIPEGYEVANIVINTSGKIAVNVIRED